MELQIFENPKFGKVRTVQIKNEPWLVGKDVAEALGYSNTRDALSKRVDEEDKGVAKCDTLGGTQEMTVINESGLYSLVFGSKLPEAKEFKHWVTSEVLPSVRKNGGYIAGQENMTDDELMAKALLVAQNKIKEKDLKLAELNKKIETNQPLVVFGEAVSCSNTCILMSQLAKLITQNGYPIGQNRLFKWMRDNKYLIRDNTPTQYSMERKWFMVKERTINNPDGSIRITKTTMVTGKGQIYFINKFLKLKEKKERAVYANDY